MSDLVDQLLAQTGLYIGPDVDPSQPGDGPPSLSRIRVTALPGDAGVAFDYEVLSHSEDRPNPHGEHTILARTSEGLALFTSHIHAPVATLLSETKPGYFEAAEGASPFPVAIRIEVPEKDRIIYAWSYGDPGGALTERDLADVRR